MTTISELILQKIKIVIDPIINAISSTPNKTEDFLLQPKTRWILAVLIVILNVNSYNQTKQKHSSNNCLPLISCKIYYVILFFLLIIINTIFFYYLEKKVNVGLPKYSWAILSIIAFMAIYNIFESSKIIEKDGNFHISPFARKFIIVSSNLFLFLFSSLSTLIEFHATNIKNIDNNNNANANNNSTLQIIPKIKLVEVVIHFINLISSIVFVTCKYNLPNTWRL